MSSIRNVGVVTQGGSAARRTPADTGVRAPAPTDNRRSFFEAETANPFRRSIESSCYAACRSDYSQSADGMTPECMSLASSPRSSRSLARRMSKVKHQPLASVDLTTGVAPWKIRDVTSGKAIAAPTTTPHEVWHKPDEGSWLGNSSTWPVGDRAFEVSFQVSAAEVAFFRLQYAVDNVLKAAYLNGKQLDLGTSVGFQGLNRQMAIKAAPGEGLFCYGENRLEVVVTNTGSSDNPGGFYLTGKAFVNVELTTGEALWQLAHDHGPFAAGGAPTVLSGSEQGWDDPERGSWLGDSKAWPAGEAIMSLKFDVSVPDMACFELPCSFEGGTLKAAHLNGRSLDVTPGSPGVVVFAAGGKGLFVPGLNYLTMAIETPGNGPFGFYARGNLVMVAPPSSRGNVTATESALAPSEVRRSFPPLSSIYTFASPSFSDSFSPLPPLIFLFHALSSAALMLSPYVCRPPETRLSLLLLLLVIFLLILLFYFSSVFSSPMLSPCDVSWLSP